VKYAVVTFGCRVNQADSLCVEAALSTRGAESVPADRADLVIVNTCSVTASADQGARQTIRRIARENPSARIVATGCYATRCAREVAALPGVVAVIPNEQKGSPQVIAALFDLAGQPLDLHAGPCGRPTPGLMGRTAWTLRVQTGCEERCSYCIIPSTRGASRSRPLEEIQSELVRVASAGYKEVVLTGVHLGSYGRDLRPRRSLADLLASLAALDLSLVETADGPIDRLLLRVSSLEPMDCTPDVVDVVARRSARDASDPGVVFAPHFHLPVQHASDPVLQRMRRPYSRKQYAALVDTIRQRLPHASIGSDVLVGFPGETDHDFEILDAYLTGSPLTHLHVFPYSERPGTDAATYPDKVSGTTVKQRAERARAISRCLQERFRAGQRGTRRLALTIDDGRSAVTDNYIRVAIDEGRRRNEWVPVTL
jgi:threonylcarbamoyladenosine tRNA methylthiotransferase MtaB